MRAAAREIVEVASGVFVVSWEKQRQSLEWSRRHRFNSWYGGLRFRLEGRPALSDVLASTAVLEVDCEGPAWPACDSAEATVPLAQTAGEVLNRPDVKLSHPDDSVIPSKI